MDRSSVGSLIVRTFVAGDALPITESIVRISGAGEYNSDIKYTLITDEDGITRIVALPAPSSENSMSSDAVGPAFSLYDVTVSKDGYYSKTVRGVEVFENILSVLTVEMLPYTSYSDGGSYPRGNLNSDVSQNRLL